MTTTTTTKSIRRARAALWAWRLLPLFGAAALALPAARAADTDISNQPLATRPSVVAKPNLLFILDDSGSMNLSYMPDDLGQSGSDDNPYDTWRGYRAAQCNGLAFDPTLPYLPPLKADGTSYPNVSFSAAPTNGYNSSSSTTNLANSVYYSYTGSQRKMGWVYDSSGPVNNTFLQECKTSTTSTTAANALFPPNVMTSASANAQKYANWYSYYRKRFLLMRTAMGQAISRLDSSYRVGFSQINQDTVQAGATFRDVKDFDTQQKADFYTSLYSATPSGSTPLRKALSKAGRYFANKAPNQSYDPVQYSCQRNFALLSTDGYWNSSYGVDLSGNNVGQQDGAEARPMRDGSQSTTTEVVTHTASATRNSIATTTRTRRPTRDRVTTSATAGQGDCSSNRYRVTTQQQRRTDTETTRVITPQSGVASYTTTNTWIDGVLSSGPTDSPVTTKSWVNVPPTRTEGPTVAVGTYADRTGVSPSYSCTSTKGDGVDKFQNEQLNSWGSSSTDTGTSTESIGVYAHSAPVSNTTTSGGTANTLADVAQYYYKTDLRTTALGNCTANGENVCPNSVASLETDGANWQHMNTYTIGLGVNGTLAYDRNYLTQAAGSYVSLKSGAVNWPQPEGYNSGSGNDGNATNVDDLWHAAVNGRGQYYSALNAADLADAINGVVTSVQAVAGASAAAATSSVDLIAGDTNQVYRASYTTGDWTGDLQAFSFNGTTGAIATTATWSAQAQLDVKTPASRTIYFNGTSGLQAFSYDNLSATQKSYFANICQKAGQCSDLADADKTAANSGTNLVDYLRGVRTYEAATTGLAALYRGRKHVLGDVINGAPVRVGKPPFSYADTGYADFVTTRANRKPVVYVAANDGMLHAISADTADGGAELWAFVPTAVMPKLYKLADKNYGNSHQYFVDGAPVMADIKVGTTWKTILVGGLGGGGGGYYALDITNPASPSLLWEFTDANLGLTYGNPVIGKRSDGSWIVAFASGYNNGSGDGKGRLYVLNANTGAPVLAASDGTAMNSIPTSAGSTDTPSGLNKINAWVTSRTNNTIERLYGGDLQGNLWRFDIDNRTAPFLSAMRLAKLQTGGSLAQPITTKPELAKISDKVVVLVGTGRYLGVSDVENNAQQSIYAIKDNLSTTGWGDVRANTTDFVRQTLSLASASATTATVSDLAVDWASKGGWWMDLPHTRERVATGMSLLAGALMVGTATPSGDACTIGGSSWFYTLDATNGGIVNASVPAGALWSASSLIAGQTLVRDANGNRKNLVTDTAGNIRTQDIGGSTSGLGAARRSSWRELMN